MPAAALAPAGSSPQRVTPPAAGSLRSFKVCANLDCSTFKTVGAAARSVGQHVAIYLDTAAATTLDSAQLDTLQQVFDTRVYAIDTAAFGRESDIDSNGVVIALLTPVVNAMVTRTLCDTAGFVVGFFYSPDLDPTTAAQYNHGEIFYAIVPDPLATISCAHSTTQVMIDLPVTFLHEFQHMINYVQHVLVRGGPPEDDWLDEALSKYAEELGGRSYLPGDSTSFFNYTIDALYDAYQYLLNPQQHFLLTTSDQKMGDVGAGWLYVRYLVDRFGSGLPARLVQTSLVGTANVAAQTGAPFELSAERWALANWVSDLPGFTPPAELTYSSWSFRQTFQLWNLIDATAFPKPWPLEPPGVSSGGSITLSGSLDAGSAQYLLVVQPASGAGITLHVNYGAAPIPESLVPRLSVLRFR